MENEKIAIKYYRKKISKPKEIRKKNIVKFYLNDDEIKLLNVSFEIDGRKTVSDFCRYYVMTSARKIYFDLSPYDRRRVNTHIVFANILPVKKSQI